MPKTFAELEPTLSATTLAAVTAMGFTAMTPVQAATIPLFLGHKDVCVEACTGSGKTLAYAIPVVERLLKSEDVTYGLRPEAVGAVIIAPTRELAKQIHDVVNKLVRRAGDSADNSAAASTASKVDRKRGKQKGKPAAADQIDEADAEAPLLRSLLFVGGTDVAVDEERLRTSGCNIMIGTPGRLLDIMRRIAAGGLACTAGAASAGAGAAAGAPALTLRSAEVLVLDEADTLLDMGFAEALQEMLSLLPKQRRTGLFSATQTREVKALAKAGLRNPAVISVQVQRNTGAAAAPAAAGAGAAGAAGGAPKAAAADSSKAKAARTAAAAAAGMDEDGGSDGEAREDGEEAAAEEEEGVADADAGDAAAGAASGTTQSVPVSLSNYYSVASCPCHKLEQLLGFLRDRAAAGDKAIVFVLTCASVDYLGKALADPTVRAAAGLPPAEDFPILPLHGQMQAKKRTAHYAAFLASGAGALLCTDVAARGIDVPDVDWICQYDPPKDPAFYIHRVGRTARAGRRGAALLLLLEKEAAGYLPLLAVKRVPISERRQAVALASAEILGLEEEVAEAAAQAARAAAEAAAQAAKAAAEAAAAKGAGKRKGDKGKAAAAADAAAASIPAPAAAPAAPPVDLDAVVAVVGGREVHLPSDPPYMRLPVVRALLTAALRDRDVLEKATRAFISFMRGYGEHACKFVFKPEQLDTSALAASFGCVKLPKLDELRAKRVTYPGVPGVDTSAIAFADPVREAARQKRLLTSADDEAAKRAARDARRDKAIAEAKAAAAVAAGEAGVAAKKRKRVHNSYAKKLGEDWDVLAEEERLEKRLKAGRISKAEYKTAMARLNRQLGVDDEDGDLLVETAVVGAAASKRARAEAAAASAAAAGDDGGDFSSADDDDEDGAGSGGGGDDSGADNDGDDDGSDDGGAASRPAKRARLAADSDDENDGGSDGSGDDAGAAGSHDDASGSDSDVESSGAAASAKSRPLASGGKGGAKAAAAVAKAAAASASIRSALAAWSHSAGSKGREQQPKQQLLAGKAHIGAGKAAGGAGGSGRKSSTAGLRGPSAPGVAKQKQKSKGKGPAGKAALADW